jgi:hypothetical protein
MTELVGHKLQASEADDLVRDEVGAYLCSPAPPTANSRLPKRTEPPMALATMLMSRAAIEPSRGGESARFPLPGAPTVGVSFTG